MKNKKTLIILSLFITAIITLFACQKETVNDAGNIPAGKSQLEVMLTDDPSQIYDSIFINIQKLEVKVEDSTGAEHWDVLNIRPGIYNILRFRNGLDTLLASGYIPGSEVKKIRLTLGTGNYAMLNGTVMPLDLNPGDSVITIDVDGDLDNTSANHFRIWLDMDGHGSIRIKSNGRLELRLKLGHFCRHNSGEIEGQIAPSSALPAMLMAISGSDTLTAIPEQDGEFKIRGIKSNTATVIIKPSNGYQDSVIHNVPVRFGEDTHLGRIVLHR